MTNRVGCALAKKRLVVYFQQKFGNAKGKDRSRLAAFVEVSRLHV